ncbi:hypothetical protein SAMN05443665_103097 [Actinomadura meyerae]|uniref:DUF4190 domain-containing protein n=1 Tax=Actinomadura meyerae TaxID=240840 RepID=A0A239MS85_9ACTN|nr:hypothetical protein [Actinomadura meyerae]SNT44828.1 hypothetical protein SAMN05443665_103097 [Actinomadura meyerae]
MTLPGYQTYAPPAPPRRSGLARASQVLGIAGLVGLVFCLAGLIPALIGLVLGVISLVRKEPDRRPAVVGVVCSALALLIGAGVAFWLLNKAVQCADETKYPDETSRRGCVEREFPYAHADVQSAGAVSAGAVSAGVVPHSAKARTASSLSAEA